MTRADEFKLGNLRFEPASGELKAGARSRRLEPKAAAVLAALCDNRDAVMSRQQLLDDCWGSGEGSDEALTQAIAQIRKALSEFDAPVALIETLARRGYRLRSVPAGQPDTHAIGHLSPVSIRILLLLALIAFILVAVWFFSPHSLRHAIRHTFGLGGGTHFHVHNQ